MLDKIIRSLLTVIGALTGLLIGFSISATKFYKELNLFSNNVGLQRAIIIIFSTIFFGFLLFLTAPLIITWVKKLMKYVEKSFQALGAVEIMFGAIGAIIGLIISYLVLRGLFSFIPSGTIVPIILNIVSTVINILVAVVSANVFISKRQDILSLFTNMNFKSKKSKSGHSKGAEPKILDTSVIIDGRIFDICQTGFIEGSLIIPTFVLEELRHIADSFDSIKRNRGRRGLDVLNRIQKELSIDVQIYEKDFPDIAEVDSKLLKLAQVLNGKVITNDYNLNKVAEFQGVPVLNINELANAIKPVVLPGEEMRIQIIKDGKESNQGIAYLDDGTMIVVEGGRKFIGETLDVIVTSVLQTAAGRMIFAKQKEALEKAN